MSSATGRKKIIIDTDPGVDDAMAIIMALDAHKREKIEVIAITLVKGNCSLKDAERNVLRVLELFELEDTIPVYVGNENNLVVETTNDGFHGSDGFNDAVFSHYPDVGKIKRNEMAHQAILRYTNEYPGQITLVAIGPLTTVATCIICDPTFGSRLQSMLVMGGTSAAEGNVTINAEFNFLFDPEAAHVVINRANCRLRLVPWETCYRHKIDWAWRLNDLGSIDTPQAVLMNKIEEPLASQRYFGDQYMSACDQICMAIAIDESCCLKSSKEKASVELQGTHTRGMLVVDKRYWFEIEKKNIEIINAVNVERVKELMKQAFGHE